MWWRFNMAVFVLESQVAEDGCTNTKPYIWGGLFECVGKTSQMHENQRYEINGSSGELERTALEVIIHISWCMRKVELWKNCQPQVALKERRILYLMEESTEVDLTWIRKL